MATLKPRKITATANGPNMSISVKRPAGKSAGIYKPSGGARPKAVAPTQPAVPVAPTPIPPPKIATGPPPPTVQSTLDRNSSKTQYGTLNNGVNDQIRQLAMGLGMAQPINQYNVSYESKLADPNDPNSMVESPVYGQTKMDIAEGGPGSGTTIDVLRRNLAAQKQNIDESNNAQNTFFSSRRIADLGKADTGYNADYNAAYKAYDDAVKNLVSQQLQPGRDTLGTNFAGAGQADIDARNASPPVAQDSTPAAPSWNGQVPGSVLYQPGQQLRPTKQNTSVSVAPGWIIVVGPDGKPLLKKLGT